MNEENNSMVQDSSEIEYRKRKYSPAYYAMRKYAGTVTVDWNKIHC